MIEINLVPDIKQELIKAERIRSTVIMAAVVVGIVSVVIAVMLAVYVFGGQTIRAGMADSSIKTESVKLQAIPDLAKTLTIQNQLSKISALNASKNVDSRIFDVLGAIIPPAPNDIKISTLSINSDEKLITIDGQASNSYAAVETFKKTIEGALIKFTGEKTGFAMASNISTSNTSYGESSTGERVLRFTISFNYAPELFSPASKDLRISISINGNVTDSYLGIPMDLFVDRASDVTGGQ